MKIKDKLIKNKDAPEKEPKSNGGPGKINIRLPSLEKKKESNWEKLQKQDIKDSRQYRDVYEDQQFDRSEIDELKSPTSRLVLVVIATVLVMVLTWTLVSIGEFGLSTVRGLVGNAGTSISQSVGSDAEPYYKEVKIGGSEGSWVSITAFQAIDENGNPFGPQYETAEEVPVPDWYVAKYSQNTDGASGGVESDGVPDQAGIWFWLRPSLIKILLTLLVGLAFFTFFKKIMMKNLEAQNLLNRVDDINQYANDQHIALPEEVMEKFDFFPDVGAHSSVQVSSLISHVALENKGIKPIQVTQRVKKDVKDENGEVTAYKGEVCLDEDGEVISQEKPLFDKDFSDALFEASKVPDEKGLRKAYLPAKIPYNPGNKNREKLKGYDTVADLINGDWTFPDYEVQRPAGAYVVDTNPVNTMV